MRADVGDFEVQTKQGRIKKGSKKKYNTAIAVKANQEDDRVIYDAKTELLTLNGDPLGVVEGTPADIPGGGSVEKVGPDYEVTSEAGDQVSITVFPKYVDLSIKAGADRQSGEMKGSLGQFDSDADPANDLVLPDGSTGPNGAQASGGVSKNRTPSGRRS